MKCLLFLISIFSASPIVAQQTLCLSGSTQHGIVYNAEQVSSFLHIEQYNAIFYGEQHNSIFDPEIKYALIEHLHKNYGFRHIFMEVGISAAWRYTQYLQTGDTSWLVHPRLVMTGGGYRNFWRHLYEYNKMLPDSQRIVIHGIDFERTEIFATLYTLSKQGNTIPHSIIAVNDTIKAHINDSALVIYTIKGGKLKLLNDEVPFNNTMQYVRAVFAANEADARAYFEENYPLAKYILSNPGHATLYPNHRNKTMTALMQDLIEQQHITKFIGFFGSTHTNYSMPTSLTNFITKQKKFGRGKTLTIREIVYNMQVPKEIPLKTKQHMEELLAPGCKALIVPAQEIPAYKKEADFILIIDNSSKN